MTVAQEDQAVQLQKRKPGNWAVASGSGVGAVGLDV